MRVEVISHRLTWRITRRFSLPFDLGNMEFSTAERDHEHVHAERKVLVVNVEDEGTWKKVTFA